MANQKSGQPGPAVTFKRPGGGGPGGRNARFGPVAKPKDTKETLRRLWRYLGRQKGRLSLVFLLVILASGFSIVGPYLIGKAIDDYMVPGDFRGLAGICLVLLAVYGLGALATWWQNYVMIGTAQKTVLAIRQDVFHQLQTLPVKFFDQRAHGDLMSRLTNDVDNISSTLANSVTQLFSSVLMLVGTLGIMLWLSPLLTLLTLSVVPLMGLSTGKIAQRTRNLFTQQQQALGEINGFIEEIISGQRVVQVFNREEKVLGQFTEINSRLRQAATRAQIFSGFVMPLMHVFNNLGFAIVAAAGGYLAVQGIITVGVIASFLNYSRQFARPLNEVANQFNMVQSALAGAERVFAIMQEEPETYADTMEQKPLTAIKGAVEFKDVDFGYRPDIPVLKKINLAARPGEKVALVGPTGAGKTTIINLLTRFYDVDQGAIYIDGRDIRSVDRESLRRLLGIVPQDTYLFSETVRENIRYGRLAATDTEVEEAARLANAEPFILRLPHGYETVLGEDGGGLSQGQRQLLAIARAVLADPAILILDEATSSVDTRTELHFQQAVGKLMQGRTSFVIAHRLNTIRDADQILVIDGGAIVEQGTHSELLAQKGLYYSLSQGILNTKISLPNK